MNSINQDGEHSTGTHVVALQMFLNGLIIGGKIDAPLLQITGVTDEATANAVMALQRELGMTNAEVDGNFGQDTRLALDFSTGFNVHLISIDVLNLDPTWIDPDGEKHFYLAR